MSQVSPQIMLRYGRQQQPIRTPISDLLIDPPAQTLLSTDTQSGSGSLQVTNTSGFFANQILLIGDAGNQNSEIVYCSSTTPPNSLSLTNNTQFAHTANTPVTVLYYDEIFWYVGATDQAPTTFLASANIVADQPTTNYDDLAANTGYYYAQFHNSVGSTNSVYSAPSPVGGYTLLSARAIIDAALGLINKQTSSVFSDEFGFQMIDACQMEVVRELKRWSFMQSFDTIIGQTSIGTWKIQAPANLDDNITYKSIWNFRIGREFDMVWIDKAEMDALRQGTAYSTLSVQVNTGDGSINLVSSNDFNGSGSVQVGSNVYSYGSNNFAGNLVLNGSALGVAPVGQDVFEFIGLGYPTYWTIYQGYIYHWPPTSQPYGGRNYYLDYYVKLIQTTSDYQNIILPDPILVQYYLAWKYLVRMNNGEETPASTAHFNNFVLRREKLKQKESTNRNFILNPDLGGGTSAGYW